MIFVRLFALALLFSCSGGGGFLGDGGGEESGSGYEDLNEGETELYESGPIGIPVPIAKGDEEDASRIPLGNLTIRYSNGSYEITATSGSVSTDEFLIYNVDQGTTVTGTAIDGGFETSIAADETDIIAIAGYDSTAGVITIPIFATHQSGVTTFFTTNTDSLAISSVNYESEGYLYFIVNGDLYRQDLEGGDPELIAADLPESPVAFFVDENTVYYLVEDGTLYRIAVALASLSPFQNTTKSVLASLSWEEPEVLFEIGENASTRAVPEDEDDNTVVVQAKTYVSSNGEIFVTKGFNIGGQTNNVIFSHYNSDSGALEELIGTDYDTVLFAKHPTDEDVLYVILDPEAQTMGNQLKIYRVDLTQGESAWSSATLVAEHAGQTNLVLTYVSMAEEKILLAYFSEESPSTDLRLDILDLNSESVTELIDTATINDGSHLFQEFCDISDNGQYVILSSLDSATQQVSSVFVYNNSDDSQEGVYLLPNSRANRSTRLKYNITGSRVTYYGIELDENLPQLNVLDFSTVDFDSLTRL